MENWNADGLRPVRTLALDFPRVTGEESVVAEDGLERRVVLEQCTAESEDGGAGLTLEATAASIHEDVDRIKVPVFSRTFLMFLRSRSSEK